MRWRTRRKLIYTSIALLPLFIIAGIIYAATFFPDPTCADGEQNQNESGIDCGGVCERICQAPLADVDVVWDRAFLVSNSIHNLAAYIENPNTDLIARDVPYVFRVYDTDNILITERRGQVDILPQPATVIFASGVNTSGREVGRTVFSFTEIPYWEEPEINEVDFAISNRRLDIADLPRLSLNITNENLRPFLNIQLTVLVFDSNGEAVNASQTIVDHLDVQETRSLIFTWREPFDGATDSYRTEIIPTSYELAN